MRVLHVTPCYYPATYWGGPVWSTKAICDGVAARTDFDLKVLTTDTAGPAVVSRVVPAELPYPVHYMRRVAGHSIAPGLLARLPGAVRWADVVHLTGTYNMPTLPTLAIARLLGKPVVWSPRGALQATAEWADSPHMRAKHAFERAAQFVRPEATILHVTAPVEAQESVARLPGIETRVIANAVSVPRDLPVPSMGPECRLVYLGRLHPKKGLDLLFDAIARLPRNFVLDVYGDGDADYRTQLAARAASSDGRIRMPGHVEGEAKTRTLATADLFILPSYSENFGIAVAEALAHATPVLTTTATPWADIEGRGCGRVIDLATADLAAEIRALAKHDLVAMGARGRAWMARDFAPEAMVQSFAELYRDIAAPSARAVIA